MQQALCPQRLRARYTSHSHKVCHLRFPRSSATRKSKMTYLITVTCVAGSQSLGAQGLLHTSVPSRILTNEFRANQSNGIFATKSAYLANQCASTRAQAHVSTPVVMLERRHAAEKTMGGCASRENF